jgi:hypothetical protein
MKNRILTILLMLPALALAATPNPADYTVQVHVQSCRLINQCSSDGKGSSCGYAQHLNATIGGKKYELERLVETNMLRAGDYKAKLVVNQKPRAEEYTQIYEFLFSDKKTGRFIVVGEPK